MDTFFDSLPEYIELVMGNLSVLIVIAIPIAVFIAYQKTKNETEQAKKTAALLGLNYVNVADEMKDSKPQDSFLLGLLSRWSTWAMEGTYNSVPVRVEEIVKSKQQRYIERSDMVSVSNPTRTTYSKGTKYDASFEGLLPFDIIIRQNISMSFGLIKGQNADSIVMSDEELDKIMFVSGSDENKIKEWLNSEQRKDVLKKLYKALPSVNMNKDGLHLHERHSKADYERINNNLTLLTEAVQKLKVN